MTRSLPLRASVTALLVVSMASLPAYAAELDDLLDESRDASYSAEQLVTCETPQGPQSALLELEQRGEEIRYGGQGGTEPDTWSGYGSWLNTTGGSVIEPAASDQTASLDDETTTYEVDDGEPTEFLGRGATLYQLTSSELTRAELVVDDQMGVFLSVTTFDDEGNTYCKRRFISFDPEPPEWDPVDPVESDTIVSDLDSNLPDTLGPFTRVDVYTDETGLQFAYYSDGFFSFAVFESPVPIAAAGAEDYQTDDATYARLFTPGQVTYTWGVGAGGMALIGDLPPDMHDEVLGGLDSPMSPGFFQRLWRSIFG